MRIILVYSVGMVKRLRVSLGTLVAIEATSGARPDATASAAADIPGETARAEAAVEQAFEAIEHVNRLMHPRAQGSHIARINSARLHVPLEVHRSIGQLLNLARRINELTEGVFDPCTPAQPGRLNNITVSSDETEVVCHAPLALDFGGFAKGYAVDCAIEVLMASGCTSGLVNAGGDLRVFGQRNEPLFVRGPSGALTNIELRDIALAVSNPLAQQRPPEHQGYYVRSHNAEAVRVQQETLHLFTQYAAVVASTATVADALAKSVLLCRPSVASRALRAFSARQLRI